MLNKLKHIATDIKIQHVIIVWLAVNLFSAAFTLLYTDESYYRLFAGQLAFGYFDHPPMLALFIRIGTLITNYEIGVRLLSVLAIASGLFFTYRLSGANNPVLFLAAIMSIFGLNLLGFLALPDAPLLLFTVLFFVIYRKFLGNENFRNAILLSFIMAALLYSKYHGILVIVFTIASNPKLLKSSKFWFSTVLGAILFVPHLIWQAENNFVTLSYHLFGRSSAPYEFSVTLEYVIGQIFYYGPFTAIFMYTALVRYKSPDSFERALIWNVCGITCFFLLSSFKGRVEVNWTLPVLIPLLILFMKYSKDRPVFRKRFYYMAAPVILLILMFRIQMIHPVIDMDISRIDDLRNQKSFVKEVVSMSHGLPIVTNSYQKAGIISYYSGSFVPSTNLNGRRNQFDLWHSADSLRFRKVAYLNNYLESGENINNPLNKGFKVTVIDSLPVMNDIIITVKQVKNHIGTSKEFKIDVILEAGKPYRRYKDAGEFKTRLEAEVYSGDNLLRAEVCPFPVNELLERYDGKYSFRIISPPKKGRYNIVLAIKTSELGIWSNRVPIGLRVY